MFVLPSRGSKTFELGMYDQIDDRFRIDETLLLKDISKGKLKYPLTYFLKIRLAVDYRHIKLYRLICLLVLYISLAFEILYGCT